MDYPLPEKMRWLVLVCEGSSVWDGNATMMQSSDGRPTGVPFGCSQAKGVLPNEHSCGA